MAPLSALRGRFWVLAAVLAALVVAENRVGTSAGAGSRALTGDGVVASSAASASASASAGTGLGLTGGLGGCSGARQRLAQALRDRDAASKAYEQARRVNAALKERLGRRGAAASAAAPLFENDGEGEGNDEGMGDGDGEGEGEGDAEGLGDGEEEGGGPGSAGIGGNDLPLLVTPATPEAAPLPAPASPVVPAPPVAPAPPPAPAPAPAAACDAGMLVSAIEQATTAINQCTETNCPKALRNQWEEYQGHILTCLDCKCEKPCSNVQCPVGQDRKRGITRMSNTCKAGPHVDMTCRDGMPFTFECTVEDCCVPRCQIPTGVSSCWSFGDPHMITFDQQAALVTNPEAKIGVTFGAAGIFWVVKTPAVWIQAKTFHRFGQPSSNEAVYVGGPFLEGQGVSCDADGMQYHRKRTNVGSVEENGTQPVDESLVKIEHSLSRVTMLGKNSRHLKGDFKFTATMPAPPRESLVNLTCVGRNNYIDYVITMRRHSNKIFGQCGDFDGDAENDPKGIVMEKEFLVDEKERLWLSGANAEQSEETAFPPSCTDERSPERLAAQARCEKEILDYGAETADWFLKMCAFDSCVVQAGQEDAQTEGAGNTERVVRQLLHCVDNSEDRRRNTGWELLGDDKRCRLSEQETAPNGYGAAESHSALTLASCRAICELDPRCKGVEYQEAYQFCNVWLHTPTYLLDALESTKASCWKYTKPVAENPMHKMINCCALNKGEHTRMKQYLWTAADCKAFIGENECPNATVEHEVNYMEILGKSGETCVGQDSVSHLKVTSLEACKDLCIVMDDCEAVSFSRTDTAKGCTTFARTVNSTIPEAGSGCWVRRRETAAKFLPPEMRDEFEDEVQADKGLEAIK